MTTDDLKHQLTMATKAESEGSYDLAESLVNTALLELSLESEPLLYAEALLILGNVEWRRGDSTHALKHLTAALAIARDLDDLSCTSKILNSLGIVNARLGLYNEALEHYHAALMAFTELGDLSRVARVTGNIGTVYVSLSMYDKALEYFGKALAAHTELGDRSNVAVITGNIGIVHWNLSSYEKALEFYGAALITHDDLGDESKAAHIRANVGSVYQVLGAYDIALEYFNAALMAHTKLGEKSGVARVTGSIGVIYKELGSYDKALECYNAALLAHTELGEKSKAADITANLGNLFEKRGLYDKALEYQNSALVAYTELDQKTGLASVTGSIGNVHVALGSFDKAFEFYSNALALSDDVDASWPRLHWLLALGKLYANGLFSQYETHKAQEYLQQALNESTTLGVKSIARDSCQSLYQIYKNNEQWKDAVEIKERHDGIVKEINLEEARKQAERFDYERKQAERDKHRAVAQASLEAKHHATQSLLHRVLPGSIATRMIDGETEIADYFERVSILFADIVGFTPLTSEMPAYLVVRLLNNVFSKFDHIIKKHGCEKIKTIGDGYMAVAGAPDACDDHAERIASAALEMQQAIHLPDDVRVYLPEGAKFGVRIGLHTGSVVAGVIGDERFVWDIYSDAVNTAARMESHGEPDKIHVTHDFVRHLQNRFSSTKNTSHCMTFEKRGEVEIKGKGMMRTYYLIKTNGEHEE